MPFVSSSTSSFSQSTSYQISTHPSEEYDGLFVYATPNVDNTDGDKTLDNFAQMDAVDGALIDGKMSKK